MRLALFAVWVVMALVAILPILRGRSLPSPKPPVTTDELVKQSFASLKAGALEIRPGQSKILALMRRLAPDFINGQLWKSSKKLVPAAVG